MPARISRRDFAKSVIDRSIRQSLDSLEFKPRLALEGLLREIQARSGLLRPSSHVGRVEPASVEPILRGLLALLEHRNDWLRTVEGWEPRGRRSVPIFSSLAHHLVTDYPVPPVLLSAWFLGSDWRSRQKRRWFCEVGRGVSLRKVALPMTIHRRTAHEFAHAPAHFSIDFALRWSQVRALGGMDPLARAVAGTRLGREFHNDDFWVSVLHFFINHPRLELARIDSIVEFLHHQKFEEQQVVIGEDSEVAVDPPQPDLSIKGWSLGSLLRRVEEWSGRPKEAAPKRTLIRWGRSAIGEFRGEDDAGRPWTIRELLDSDQLAEEGRAMDHCVATYTASCARRSSTIWSVATEAAGGRKREATVEVNPETRELVQASAMSNDDPDEACWAIVKRWASLEGLKIPVEDAPPEVAAVDPPAADIGPRSVLVVDVTIGASVPFWQDMTI